jgi:hypothetical protein
MRCRTRCSFPESYIPSLPAEAEEVQGAGADPMEVVVEEEDCSSRGDRQQATGYRKKICDWKIS